MARYVDLSAVESGCLEIDKAIEWYEEVKSKIAMASELLGENHLQFGRINSSLTEQLDILKSQVEKCSAINDGVTSTIRSNAQAQYQEYLDSLKDKDKEKKYIV